MNVIITQTFFTGLGDMYSALYQLWYRQEELKKLGFNVKSYVFCPSSFYKNIDCVEDCNFLYDFFDFSVLDNYEIIKESATNFGGFPNCENFKLINNWRNAVRVYIDVKSQINNLSLEDFDNIIDRDDLPSKNLFSTKIIEFCENKISNLPKNFSLIHFRQHENNNIDDDFEKSYPVIKQFIETNNNEKIMFISSSEKTKNLLKEKKNNNIVYNEYKQNDIWITRGLNLNDNELFDQLKYTIIDMYLVSYAKKILKVGIGWTSNFLFYGIINNKTNIPNKIRFQN